MLKAMWLEPPNDAPMAGLFAHVEPHNIKECIQTIP